MNRSYRVVRLGLGFDLRAFDCGEPSYNEWLSRHALPAVHSGVCAVYLLVEADGDRARVVGYYAIRPSQAVRDDVPGSMARGGAKRRTGLEARQAGDPRRREDRQGSAVGTAASPPRARRGNSDSLAAIADAGGVVVSTGSLLSGWLR